jgi:hypothetical protein
MGEGMRGTRLPTTTTLIAADAMIVPKTKAQAPHHRGLRFLIGTFSARLSHGDTAHRRTSQSTPGKQTLDCGLRITGSLARLVAWIVITHYP